MTARLPFGDGEPFIVPEIAQLVEDGCDVTIVPVRGRGGVVHADARELLGRTLRASPPAVLRAALAELAREPLRTARAFLLVLGSRDLRILVKNIAVFPKGLWLGHYARGLGADHLHAHWASTTSTVAMVAAEIAGIPWSLTAHRWDIAEDNLLRAKAARACFVRAISAHGAQELSVLVGNAGSAPWVLHMGVRLALPRPLEQRAGEPLRVLTAARFVEKKGHVFLLEAVGLLRERGVPLRLELAGEGPLEAELRQKVLDLRLADEVVFLGRVSHETLLSDMRGGRWGATALASIVTADGQLEGIPVSLIEALGCGLPAVATEVGGIPELLGDGAGLLVPPADPEALAEALALLSEDPALAQAVAERGRKRVEDDFSVERITRELLARFVECGARSQDAPRSSS
ncbi:MAG TPA: glycosyltransferase [Gaiellaceae bacterium]|nr:glycosyltransferase [Gaiellaceae bacterium]